MRTLSQAVVPSSRPCRVSVIRRSQSSIVYLHRCLRVANETPIISLIYVTKKLSFRSMEAAGFEPEAEEVVPFNFLSDGDDSEHEGDQAHVVPLKLASKRKGERRAHEGHIYVSPKLFASDGITCSWRCQYKLTCKGRLYTNVVEGEVIRTSGVHNHHGQQVKVQAELFKQAVKRRAGETLEVQWAIVIVFNSRFRASIRSSAANCKKYLEQYKSKDLARTHCARLRTALAKTNSTLHRNQKTGSRSSFLSRLRTMSLPASAKSIFSWIPAREIQIGNALFLRGRLIIGCCGWEGGGWGKFFFVFCRCLFFC